MLKQGRGSVHKPTPPSGEYSELIGLLASTAENSWTEKTKRKKERKSERTNERTNERKKERKKEWADDWSHATKVDYQCPKAGPPSESTSRHTKDAMRN